MCIRHFFFFSISLFLNLRRVQRNIIVPYVCTEVIAFLLHENRTVPKVEEVVVSVEGVVGQSSTVSLIYYNFNKI